MQQQYNGSDSTITIWVDGAQIRTMENNELAVYHTPGSGRVYIDSKPQWQEDYCVASVQELIESLGYDSSDGLNEEDVAELTLEVR